MSKIRVHELAKELNISSKELLNFIDRLGIENKKAASNLEDSEVNTVKDFFRNNTKSQQNRNNRRRPDDRQDRQAHDAPKSDQPKQDRQGTERQDRTQPDRQVSRQGDRPRGIQQAAQRPPMEIQNQGPLRIGQDRPQRNDRNRNDRHYGGKAKPPNERSQNEARQSHDRAQNERVQGIKAQTVKNDTLTGEKNQHERNQTDRGQGESPLQHSDRAVADSTHKQVERHQTDKPLQHSDRAAADRHHRQGERLPADKFQQHSDRAAADKAHRQGERPQADRPQNERQQGDRTAYQNNRSLRNQNDSRQQGDRQQGDRQQGDRQQGDRQQGDRQHGDRQQGDRQQGDRQQGDRQQGDRQQGDRQQGGRQQGQQSWQRQGQNQGQGQRPYSGNRPQGAGRPRPEGQREGYQGGQKPQGQTGRPYSQGSYGDRQRTQTGKPGEGTAGGQGGDRRNNQRYPGGGQRPYGSGQGAQGGANRGPGKPGFKPKDGTARPAADAAVKTQKDTQKGLKRYDKNKDPRSKGTKYENEVAAVPAAKKPAAKPNVKKLTKKEKKKQQLQKQLELENEMKAKEGDIKVIQVGKSISVKDLAEKLGRGSGEIIKLLMKIGIMATLNQEVDYYTAANIAETFDVITEEADEIDILEEAFKEEDDESGELVERPPVVVVMGHVDHGKTSLLDAIRKSHVTAGEAGGITQHIGAYTVTIDEKPITFLDTPGHEAFTAMRMRGAQVTDIAVLVVAADDGVMPQTIEAINHAKAANVDIIVAINKIDKPSANPDRVKQELTEYGILTEDWGGETICVPVSATQKIGIDQLLEMILLVAEVRELKATPDKKARGTVIEAELDKGKGSVATVLVQDGTLKIGDPIVAGRCYGRIRAMMDDKGNRVKKVGPSMPVEIIGLSEVPMAGDMFYVAKNERYARQVAESVHAQGREDMIKDTPQKVSLDDLFNQIQSGNVKDLNIIIKADVQGSVEAVKNSLERLSNNEVRIRVIHGGVGAVTESDVMLASASNAIIIGFNVRPEVTAKSVADAEKVDLRLYRIIYNAIEDVTAAMKGMLDPVYKEKVIGHAQIRQLFRASGVGTIGGCYVTDGKIMRNSKVRIVRNGIVVFEGELAALKRFKDDVKEVASNYECGLSFVNFNDIKEGDVVEAYIMEEVAR